MSADEVKTKLQYLPTPARKIFSVLFNHKHWLTRRELASAIGHTSLFRHDRLLLEKMINAGLVEMEVQDFEVIKRYRYRVPDGVRASVQRLLQPAKIHKQSRKLTANDRAD